MDRSSTGSELMPARPDAPEFIKNPIPHFDESDANQAAMAAKFTPTQSKCDYQVLPDEVLAARCAGLLSKAHDEGMRLYIHCSNGHFRTGTVCAMLIGMAYELSGHHALLLYQALHDMAGNVFDRGRDKVGIPLHTSPTRSPGEKSFAEQAQHCRALFPEQREQVVRLLGPVRDYVRSSTAAKMGKFAAEDGLGADGDDEENEDDEFAMIKEITKARTRMLSAIGTVGQEFQPLKIKEKSIAKIGTLATVANSVSTDLSGNMKKVGLDLGSSKKRLSFVRRGD